MLYEVFLLISVGSFLILILGSLSLGETLLLLLNWGMVIGTSSTLMVVSLMSTVPSNRVNFLLPGTILVVFGLEVVVMEVVVTGVMTREQGVHLRGGTGFTLPRSFGCFNSMNESQITK